MITVWLIVAFLLGVAAHWLYSRIMRVIILGPALEKLEAALAKADAEIPDFDAANKAVTAINERMEEVAKGYS